MPRKTYLTPAIHQAIVQAVTGGMSPERAAALVEIEPYVVREWIARGEGRHCARPPKEPYVTFARDVKKARATDEARRILRINQAAQGGAILTERTITHPDGRVEREVKHAAPQWQADAWHLERSRPEDWGRRDRMDLRLTVEQLVAQTAQELGLTPQEVLAEAQALLQRPLGLLPAGE